MYCFRCKVWTHLRYQGRRHYTDIIGNIPVGSWFHFVWNIIDDVQGFEVFIDGVSEGPSAQGDSPSLTLQNKIEFMPGGNFPIDFDEFSLWNGVLNETQVQILYNMDK